MSPSSPESGSPRSGGQRRSDGGNRNRNRSGGNRNRNRSGNRGGGGGNRGGQQGRRSGPTSGPRRSPKPAPLTFWQKILKALGLYDPNKPPKRTTPSRVPQPPQAREQKQGGAKRNPERKTRTRNARTSQKPVESTRLYVGNLSYDSTEDHLKELFSGVGPVDSVEIVFNRNTKRSKGYAFIEMGSIEDAKRAVESLHDQTFMERQLIVSGAKSKGPAEPGENRESDEGRENRGRRGNRDSTPAAPVVTDIAPPEEDLVDERLGPDEPREII